MSTILECRNLQKNYGPLQALAGIDLQLESGKIIGLLGPNGSGKTTLIKIANGLLVPNGGDIRIDGKEIGVETKKIVSYLPDKNYLNNWMNVKQLLDFFSDFYDDFDLEKAKALLSRLEIGMKMRLKNMSKGTKEKVQLVLTMSRKAKLYILDEPIAGVDPAARDLILETILQNYDPQASIIISTHLIADVERILNDVIFIKKGNLILHQDKEILEQQRHMTIDEIFREEFRC